MAKSHWVLECLPRPQYGMSPRPPGAHHKMERTVSTAEAAHSFKCDLNIFRDRHIFTFSTGSNVQEELSPRCALFNLLL